MNTIRFLAALFLLLCVGTGDVCAQTIGRGQTVRKRRVPEGSPAIAPVVRAEAAIEKKDWATAEQALKEALDKDPNYYRAWFDLGFVYNATDRAADSIAAYRKAVAAKPDVFESNLNLGLMLARTGDPEAAKYLRAAATLKPSAKTEEGLARAWLSLGQVLKKSDPPGAVAAFGEAAKLRPKDPEPHLSAGQVLEQQNDLAAAEKEYRQAAALDPKSTEPIVALANIYIAAKRLPEAEVMVRQYLALDPKSPSARTLLGRILAIEGKKDEAMKEFAAALQDAPDDPTALHELAALYEADSKFADAAAQYRRLLQKNPKDAQLHRSLGLALLHDRKPAEAQAELRAAVDLKPDFGEAYGDLALAASDNQNYVLTIRALDARAKFLPEVPGTYFLRATAYDHLRAYKQAVEYYQQFLSVSNGRYPDQEWQAKHRLITIDPKSKARK